jgi:hypothetical protein
MIVHLEIIYISLGENHINIITCYRSPALANDTSAAHSQKPIQNTLRYLLPQLTYSTKPVLRDHNNFLFHLRLLGRLLLMFKKYYASLDIRNAFILVHTNSCQPTYVKILRWLPSLSNCLKDRYATPQSGIESACNWQSCHMPTIFPLPGKFQYLNPNMEQWRKELQMTSCRM